MNNLVTSPDDLVTFSDDLVTESVITQSERHGKVTKNKVLSPSV